MACMKMAFCLVKPNPEAIIIELLRKYSQGMQVYARLKVVTLMDHIPACPDDNFLIDLLILVKDCNIQKETKITKPLCDENISGRIRLRWLGDGTGCLRINGLTLRKAISSAMFLKECRWLSGSFVVSGHEFLLRICCTLRVCTERLLSQFDWYSENGTVIP